MDDGRDLLGPALRRAREGAGLSLASMARRTLFSKSYLGNVETGRKNPSKAVILAYEKALGRECTNPLGRVIGLLAMPTASVVLRQGFEAALRKRSAIDDWQQTVEAYGRSATAPYL